MSPVFARVIDAWQIDYRGSLDRFVGPPAQVWTAKLLPYGSEHARAKLAGDYRDCYDLEGWKDVTVFEGVEEMLGKLRAAGLELWFGAATMTQTHYLLDANEAAQILRMDKRTLVRWARLGHVPAHPMGGGQAEALAFCRT